MVGAPAVGPVPDGVFVWHDETAESPMGDPRSSAAAERSERHFTQ